MSKTLVFYMDIVNLSVEWARAEVFSAKVVAVVSVIVLLAAAGFWFWGKTEMARAYVLPLLLSGLFLVVVSGGLIYANQPRVNNFPGQYQAAPAAFVKSELARTAQSEHDLNLIVFRILPAIVVVSALGVIFFNRLSVRAWLVVIMFLGTFLMILDSNTKARNLTYHSELEKVKI